jgi:integrase
VEIIHDVVSKMPFESGLQKRDRALVAFTLLSGMRVGAIVSLRLKHVDLETGVITQDSREVATKGSKHITSGFFPVGFEFESIFREWVLHLRELGFQADDPIFPSAEKVRIDNAFVAGRLSRSFYVETEVARKVFKRAFIKAGHPYYNPHSFRKTLVRLGQKVCTTWEEAKAWSQNLGHADIVTTNVDYGRIDDETQIAVVRRLGHSDTNQVESNPDSLTEFIQRVAKEVKKINS